MLNIGYNMESTLMVRRIDNLGRVVIPKPVRLEMNIQEGDPLEIFIDKEQGTVIFKKYKFLLDDEEDK